MRGADVLIRSLHAAGVRTLFTLSGNQIMPVFDACLDVGIRLVHTRHEAAAVFMAEAWAQLTGEVGVALVTAAPGFGNSLGPLYSVSQSESPVLLMTGDSPVGADGRGAFQELDQVGIASGLVKRSLRPRRAADFGVDAASLLRTARAGRPGPVHMALPFDLLNAEVDEPRLATAADCRPDRHWPATGAIETIAGAIAGAERPVVILGPMLNATRAADAHARLPDALGAPVVCMESPRGLNDPSLGAFSRQLAQADVIVSLGKRIDFTTGFGAPPAMSADCRFYMVDPDPAVLDQARRALGHRFVLATEGDADAAVEQFLARAPAENAHDEWRAAMADATRWRGDEPPVTDAGAMRPAALCGAIQPHLDAAEDAVLVIDGGEVGQWAQACLSAPRRVINGPSGAIGGSLGYAIAASAARPGAAVLAFMGDGTVGFHLAEFETAARAGLPLVAVIGHDAQWNAEVQIQHREYGAQRVHACELSEARYDLAAEALGCHAEYVTTPDEAGAAVGRALASGKPACIVARIEGLPAPGGAGH